MILTEVDEIICEFIRSSYKEPARSGLSKRHTTTSQTFSGNTILTDFTVTNTKLLCVNSVSISSVAQTKYVDYQIDLRNNKIVFTTAPASGTNNISVSYDYNTSGTSWIYPDKPNTALTRTEYPRVSVISLDNPTSLMGLSSNMTAGNALIQIDIVTKSKLLATDFVRVLSDGTTETVTENLEGDALTKILTRNIIETFRTLWRTKINPKYWFPSGWNPENKRIEFEEDVGIYRRVLTVSLNGFNIGSVAP
jgi:hypothetical protein